MTSPVSIPSTTTIPVTFSHGDQSIDIVLPAAVPLIEILPSIIDELGILTPALASDGFRVLTSTGRNVDLERPVVAAGIVAGDVFTVEPIGQGETDQKYDDLVEAVAHAVEGNDREWRPSDSLRTNIAAGCILLVIVAIALWLNPGVTALATGMGAGILTIILAAIVARTGESTGAIALHWVGCALIASGAAAMIPSTNIKLISAGLALILGATTGFLTLRNISRASSAHETPSPANSDNEATSDPGPLVALALPAVMLIWAGTIQEFLDQPPLFSAVTIFAITSLIALLSPWIALARTPIRSYIPRTDDERERDNVVYTQRVVGDYERKGRAFIVALRIAAGLTLVVTIPQLVNGDIAPIVLIAAASTALLLSTRHIYARAEVLVGILTGAGIAVETVLLVVSRQPDLLPIMIWALIAVTVVVIVLGVLNRKHPPVIGRIADTASTVALLCIIPAATIASGLI